MWIPFFPKHQTRMTPLWICISYCEVLYQQPGFWQHTENSCTGLMRRSKTRGVDLPSKVLLCLLSSCHLNRSTFWNQLPGIRDGSMMLSRRNLVYLTLQTFPPHAAALPPGSLFICGHRNVNSLSLSISEKTTVTPTLPQEVVAGPKERRAELTNTRRPIDSTFAADWTDARAAQSVFLALGWVSPWLCEELYCCGTCYSSGVSETNYIQLLTRDSKKCLRKIHFHSCSPGRRQRVLFLKRIQWQRTLQSFT